MYGVQRDPHPLRSDHEVPRERELAAGRAGAEYEDVLVCATQEAGVLEGAGRARAGGRGSGGTDPG